MNGPKWGVGSDQYKKWERMPAPVRSESTLSLRGAFSMPPLAPTPAMVKARRSLVAALHLLAPHLEALTVIGAQAVYERTDRGLIVPAMTTEDGDLAVTPSLLVPSPQLGDLLRNAGYQPKWPDRPGIWMKPDDPTASIDLLVPESVAGAGRRSARTPHEQGAHVLGRAAGIEMATFDRDLITIGPFDGEGQIRAHVAGTAALLSAKSFKIVERIRARDAGSRDRVKTKDAGDMWRLIASSDGAEVRATFARAEADPIVGPSARQGRAYLLELFAEGGEGNDLVIEDFGSVIDPSDIAKTVADWITDFGDM